MKHVTGILIIITGLLVFSCDNSQSPNTDDESLNITLQRLVNDDTSFNLDGLSDEETASEIFIEDDDSDLGRNGLIENYEFPIRWGRYVESVEGNVEIDPYEPGADTVYARINKIISGNLIVINGDTTTTDSGFVFTPIDTTSKPFQMYSTRRIRFVHLFGVHEQYHGWRIRGTTPLVITSDAPTVDITSISLSRLMPDQEYQTIFSLTNTDSLLNYFLTAETMPHVFNHEFIKALVDVNNTNPDSELYPESGEGVFHHFGRAVHRKGRHPLFDDGGLVNYNGFTSHDEIANDNEFTRIWRVHSPLHGYPVSEYRMFFDVIDYETLLNPDGEYHSMIIGFPYLLIN